MTGIHPPANSCGPSCPLLTPRCSASTNKQLTVRQPLRTFKSCRGAYHGTCFPNIRPTASQRIWITHVSSFGFHMMAGGISYRICTKGINFTIILKNNIPSCIFERGKDVRLLEHAFSMHEAVFGKTLKNWHFWQANFFSWNMVILGMKDEEYYTRILHWLKKL